MLALASVDARRIAEGVNEAIAEPRRAVELDQLGSRFGHVETRFIVA